VDVHHAPWTLESAEIAIRENTMTDAWGIALDEKPPLVHFAKRLDVVVWNPERIDTASRPLPTP
jgi:hypothetical protein